MDTSITLISTTFEKIAIPLSDDSLSTSSIIEGRRIASASSRPVDKLICKSIGIECDRWTELNLFITKDDKVIAQRIKCTLRDDEQTAYEGKVCNDLYEAAEFFGRDDWLTEALFEDCGLTLEED